MNRTLHIGPAGPATVRIPGALGDPHRSQSRLGLPHRGGHRRSCRGLGRHGSAGHAERRCPAHLESRRCRLRISRHRLVLPAVRAPQTTGGRNRAAALRRHVLQGARVGEWRRGGRTRGRLCRLFLRRDTASARQQSHRRGHRQPARHVHHPGFWRARRARCLVRLVGVRRHRSRRVAQRAWAGAHREPVHSLDARGFERNPDESRVADQSRRAQRQAARHGDRSEGRSSDRPRDAGGIESRSQ